MTQDVTGRDQAVECLLLGLLGDGSLLVEGPGRAGIVPVVAALVRHLEVDFQHVRFGDPQDAARPGLLDATAALANVFLVEDLHLAGPAQQAALLNAIARRAPGGASRTPPPPALFVAIATHDSRPGAGSPLAADQRREFLLQGELPAAPAGCDSHSADQESAMGLPPVAVRDLVPQSALFEARREVRAVALDLPLDGYLAAIAATMLHPVHFSPELARWLRPGDGARAMVALKRVSQARAWLHGRSTVAREDIAAVARECLRHRLAPTPQAVAAGADGSELANRLFAACAPWEDSHAESLHR
jgi:MoxR-like ATPase